MGKPFWASSVFSGPALGAASLTQLSPLAAAWRGWLLFLVVSAHWKPSTWLSVARAEEEEGAGVGWGCDPAPWPWAAL